MTHNPLTTITEIVQSGELRYAEASPQAAAQLYATDSAAALLQALGLEVTKLDTTSQYWIGKHSDVECAGHGNAVSISQSKQPRGSLLGVVGDFAALEVALKGMKRLPKAVPLTQVQEAQGRELMMQAQAAACGLLERWAKA